MKPTALDYFLRNHRRDCNHFVFSGDRHCSCGRDEAVKELEELRTKTEQPTQIELPIYQEVNNVSTI